MQSSHRQPGGGELVTARVGLAPTARPGHAALGLRRAAVVTAGSRWALEPMLRRRPDARWLPLGVEREVETSDPSHEPGKPTDRPFRLLVAASLNRVKGPDVVLGAVARARTGLGDAVELEWFGEDTLGGSTAALARALRLEAVVALPGLRPHEVVRAAWRDADLAIQGSYHESQGVAVPRRPAGV
jgi:glycosyltransferase involved in cell wall biosynthesis